MNISLQKIGIIWFGAFQVMLCNMTYDLWLKSGKWDCSDLKISGKKFLTWYFSCKISVNEFCWVVEGERWKMKDESLFPFYPRLVIMCKSYQLGIVIHLNFCRWSRGKGYLGSHWWSTDWWRYEDQRPTWSKLWIRGRWGCRCQLFMS